MKSSDCTAALGACPEFQGMGPKTFLTNIKFASIRG
jgi:hypothetical protein